MSVGPGSVVSCCKNCNDRKEVLCEFIDGFVIVLICKYLDGCATSVKEVLEEVEAEARESVSVGNHNFLYSSANDEVQKGEKSPAFEVDARANVLDKLMVWKFGLQESNLSLQVVFLFCGGDSCVDV